MDQSVQDCQRLMQSKSYYHDSGEDTEDEMERQYVTFDSNDCLEDEELSDCDDDTALKGEVEDPVETAMRDMFEEKEVVPLRKIKVERKDEAPIELSIEMELRADVKRIVPPPSESNSQELFNATELCNTSQPCLKNSVKNFLKRTPQVTIPAPTKKAKIAEKSPTVVKAAARSPVRKPITIKPVPELLPVNSTPKLLQSPKTVPVPKIERSPVKVQVSVEPAQEQPQSPETIISVNSPEANHTPISKAKISVKVEPKERRTQTSPKVKSPVKLSSDSAIAPTPKEQVLKKLPPDAKLPSSKAKAKAIVKKAPERKLLRSAKVKPVKSDRDIKLPSSPKPRVVVESLPIPLSPPSPTVQVTVVDKPEKVPSPVVEVTVTDRPRKAKTKMLKLAVNVPLKSHKKKAKKKSAKGSNASSTEAIPKSAKEIAVLTCVVCKKLCENRRKLIKHVKSHSSDSNSYECPTCKKTFSQQCNLKRHIRIHSREKPYTCPYPFCKKDFSDQGYLRTHLRYHTNTKPYTCKTCRKGFFDRSNYIKHLKSHTGERNYACLTCKAGGVAKSFLQQSDLTRHMRVHTGIRPFQCGYCPRSFTQNTDLTTHLRHHTGERPFVCNNCEKTFANKRYLNSHVRGFICTRNAAKGKSKARETDSDSE